MTVYHGPCQRCGIATACQNSPLVTLNYVTNGAGINQICAYCSNRSAYTVFCRSCHGIDPIVPGTFFLNYTSESRNATLRLILYTSSEDIREVQAANLRNTYGWREQNMRGSYGTSTEGCTYHELLVAWRGENPVDFADVSNRNREVFLTTWPTLAMPPAQPAGQGVRAVAQVYGMARPAVARGGQPADDGQVFERMADGRIPCRCNRCR